MKLKNIILLLLGFSSFVAAQEIKSEFNKEIKIQKKLSYLLDIPQNPKTKLPLIVFLHGSGERGNDLEKVKLNGVLQHKDLIKEPVAILAPQCPANTWWDTDAVYFLIKEISEKYKMMWANIHNYKDMNLKIFHGGMDDVVLPENAFNFYQKLHPINPKAELTIFPNDNHNSWDSTYSDPKLYEWMLSFKKMNINN